jgi:hypothetical protein
MSAIDAKGLVRVLEALPGRCEAVDYHGPRCEIVTDESANAADIAELVKLLDKSNHRLWHLENEARRTDAGDAHVAAVKRAIDGWNQRRNDLVERIDRSLLALLPAADPARARLSSETPGMILDRLAILGLKLFHLRGLVGDQKRKEIENDIAERLAILDRQRSDLAGCLIALVDDALVGRAYFKLYRQLKAYNDPRLNPSMSRPS